MYKIVGIESVNYVSKKTGRPVVGQNLYVACLDSKPNLVGYTACKVYVSSNVIGIPVLSVNDYVDIFFDHSGYVQKIEKVAKPTST